MDPSVDCQQRVGLQNIPGTSGEIHPEALCKQVEILDFCFEAAFFGTRPGIQIEPAALTESFPSEVGFRHGNACAYLWKNALRAVIEPVQAALCADFCVGADGPDARQKSGQRR